MKPHGMSEYNTSLATIGGKAAAAIAFTTTAVAGRPTAQRVDTFNRYYLYY
jgi:hypothetical protein